MLIEPHFIKLQSTLFRRYWCEFSQVCIFIGLNYLSRSHIQTKHMLGQYHHNRCPPLMVRFLSVRYRYAFINEYKQLTNHYRLRITYLEHLSTEKYLPSKCTHDMRNLSCSLKLLNLLMRLNMLKFLVIHEISLSEMNLIYWTWNIFCIF